MWFITLIVLALAAALIIKAVKAQSARKSADEAQLSSTSGPQGQLNRNDPSQTNTSDRPSTTDNPEGHKAVTAEADSENSPEQTTVSAEAQQAESREIREMIKILNLTEADSSRLGINAEQFCAIRDEASTTSSAMPSAKVQADVADRLRRMLA